MSRIAPVLAGLGLLAGSSVASAHEKWFYDASLYPTNCEAILRPPVAASYIPARRSTRVDPIAALRSE